MSNDHSLDRRGQVPLERISGNPLDTMEQTIERDWPERPPRKRRKPSGRRPTCTRLIHISDRQCSRTTIRPSSSNATAASSGATTSRLSSTHQSRRVQVRTHASEE